MAVVGEANIIVRAITTGFDADLRRQLKSLGGAVGPQGRSAGESIGQAFARGFNSSSGNMFQKVSEGLKQLEPDAEQARLAFRSLVRTSYTVGTGLSVLLGGISALVGGLITLVAALGRAAPAVAGLGSAFIQMRLAVSFAQFALGGIGQAVSAATQKNAGLSESIAEINERFQQLQFSAEEAALGEERAALNLEKALENLRRSADLPPNSAARREAELAYEEAELAYRRAKDRTRDLNEEVAKGPQALESGGGNDPYAGLTESQKRFAQFLVGLRPKLDVLKEAVASGFLPVLQTQIEKLDATYFPLLEERLKEIGVALGQGAENLFDNFLDESTKAEVDEFLTNLKENIPLIGEIFGEFGELILRVFNDADGIGTKFLEFIRDTLVQWNENLEKFGLTDTFDNAFEVGSRLFGIIGNTLDGLGDFFALLDGEGGAIDILLTYLEDATSGFAALGDEGNPAAQGISDTFAGLASNFGPVMNFIGSLVDAFLKLGANPAIGEFFNKLSAPENAANWESIFEAFANAGPALGDLVITIGELFAAFADEGAPTAFFETLNTLIKPIAEFFGSESVKPFIDDIGRFFAVITAATFVLDQVKNFLLVILGNAFAIWGVFKGVGKVLTFIGTKILAPIQTFFIRLIVGPSKLLALLGRIGMFLTGPIGIAIGVVTTLLAIFFTQTETGKKIWQSLVDFFKNAVANIGSFFTTLWTNIKDGWDKTVEGFKNIDLGQIFKNLVNGAISIFEGFVNNLIMGLNNGIIKAMNMIKVDIPDWVRRGAALLGYQLPQSVGFNLPNVATIKLPRLAEGGIVMPSPGGTIAQIAEAGRPERVEPLDARGLSKRDYAMLEAIKGSSRGGINITVNPSPGMDEKELAAMVSRRIAYEIKRGAI